MSQSILIAEDNDFTAFQYDKILKKQGHKVIISKDGEDCLRKYEDARKKNKNEYENPFDIVILDHSMPKRKGKEVASDILKINPNQRIIFASAYNVIDDKESVDDFEENFEFLQKPFSLQKFVRQIGN